MKEIFKFSIINFFKKIFFILDNKFKKEYLLLFFQNLILSGLEVLSISAFLPLFLFLTKNNTNNIILNLQHYFPDLKNNYSLFLLIIIFSIFFLKFILSLLVNYKQNVYSFRVYEYLSLKLFNFYIKKNYNFYFKKNSSEITRNVYSEVGIIVDQIFTNIVELLKNLLITISILVFLLFFDFYNTIIISSSLTILIFLYFRIFKAFFIKIGDTLKNQKFFILKDINEIFSGIKEIKIFGVEDFFLKRFKTDFKPLSQYSRYAKTFSAIPRIIFEFFSVFILIIIIFLFQLKGTEGSIIIFKLGIFALAIVRILPCAVSISQQLQSLNIYYPSVINIYYELKMSNQNDINNEKSFTKKFEKINFLELKNVYFSYNNQNDIFSSISLKLPKGKIVGIFGESGSGKTTFADLISGLILPSKGEILINGKVAISENLNYWRDRIGYVTQSNIFFDDTIKNNIIFGKEFNNNELYLLNKVVEESQLNDLISSQKNGINTLVGEQGVVISGGQRQRIAIARSLFREPELLILDEATSALDSSNQRKILEIIKKIKHNMSIIVITHNKIVLKNCDLVYEIKNKQVNLINEKKK